MSTIMVKKELYTLRIDAGFGSQQELAYAANLSIKNVWNAENKRPISWKTARKIINVLKSKGMQVEVEDINWTVK